MNVEAFPFSPISCAYASHVYAGLSALAHEKLVSVRYLPARKPLTSIFGDFVKDPKHFGRAAYIEIARKNLRPVRVFFDLADADFLIAPSALKLCDCYFKRAFSTDAKRREEKGYTKKVFPYGLFYTVRGDFESQLLWRNICAVVSRGWHKTSPVHSLKTLIHSFYPRIYAAASEFIQLPESPAENKIMYQVRLFHAPSRSHYHYDVNQSRVEFIRSLKRALGDAFVGGVADGIEARQMAPDLVTNKTSMHAYLDLIRKSSICVSTEGLAGTNPDKIPTYLSMGRCIVSQKLKNELPVPLTDRKNVYFFEGLDDCIEICRHLLSNPEEVQRARNAASRYFFQHASPKKTILGCLRRAMERS